MAIGKGWELLPGWGGQSVANGLAVGKFDPCPFPYGVTLGHPTIESETVMSHDITQTVVFAMLPDEARADVAKCWCGQPGYAINPATCATDAHPACIHHLKDGYSPFLRNPEKVAY